MRLLTAAELEVQSTTHPHRLLYDLSKLIAVAHGQPFATTRTTWTAQLTFLLPPLECPTGHTDPPSATKFALTASQSQIALLLHTFHAYRNTHQNWSPSQPTHLLIEQEGRQGDGDPQNDAL